MKIEFGKVEAVATFEGVDRYMAVYVDGVEVGEAYREAMMPEWAADAGIEARFWENIAAGHANANAFKAALRKEAATGRGE